MAAGIEEPTGKAAGRVTIVTTLTSMLPTIFTCAVIVTAFLIQMISAEIAAAMLITALGLGSAITGTVFGTAKNTKTDQAAVVWGSPPVSDVVTPPALTDTPVVSEPAPVVPVADEDPVVASGTEDDAAANLAAEVDAVRGRHASTAGGAA